MKFLIRARWRLDVGRTTRKWVARGAALLAALAGAVASPVWAQAYPGGPIKIVVPFPAGGTSDLLARLIGKRLGERLGQPVIVDNRPGASGNLGAGLVAKAAPDGLTLLLTDVGNLAISPSLYNLPFKLDTSFAPVRMLGYSPHLLVVNPKVPAQNLQELLAWAKSRKGQVNFAAAAGLGSATHLAGVMLAQRSGLDWNYVAYKGGAQALTDLIGGQVDFTFNGMVATYPHVKSGRIRLLAVTSLKRWPGLPEVPAVAEVLPGFLSGSWQGLLAPAGTPQPVLDRLNKELDAIEALPDIRARLTELGAEPSDLKGAAFGQWLHAEAERMAQVVKDGHVSVD